MTDANEQPTCGKGLAEHSELPATLADVMAALAHVLEFHLGALDLSDENTHAENEAYGSLSRQFRAISADLHHAAKEMNGYVDLPMGRHDEQALGAPPAMEAFGNFVALERKLLELMQASVERDEKMLAQFNA